MKKIILLLFLPFFVSCSVLFDTRIDYEKYVDFSKYKTYSFSGNDFSGISEIDSKRFIRNVDTVMLSMGFKKSENPDFIINIKGFSRDIPLRDIEYNKYTEVNSIKMEARDFDTNEIFWTSLDRSCYTDHELRFVKKMLIKQFVLRSLKRFPARKTISNKTINNETKSRYSYLSPR